MIDSGKYWIVIAPTMAGAGDPVRGKWLHFGATDELHSWINKLNELVESGQLLSVKIARKLPGLDPVPHKPCVLCVYTQGDGSSKARAQNVLREEFGIEVCVWKSEEETEADWAPGGSLRLEFESDTDRE